MFRADSWKGWSFALVLCCGSAAAGDLRIEHVTIVSPERAAPMRDATVLIRGDRITAISRSHSPAARGKDVEVIDGTGLYLSPGLIDSHVHTGGVPACLEGRKCRPRGYQPGETGECSTGLSFLRLLGGGGRAETSDRLHPPRQSTMSHTRYLPSSEIDSFASTDPLAPLPCRKQGLTPVFSSPPSPIALSTHHRSSPAAPASHPPGSKPRPHQDQFDSPAIADRSQSSHRNYPVVRPRVRAYGGRNIGLDTRTSFELANGEKAFGIRQTTVTALNRFSALSRQARGSRRRSLGSALERACASG